MLPRVIIHNEVSLDGRMDYYLGDIGLYYQLAASLNADAMLSGSNTLLAAFDTFGAEESVEQTTEPQTDETEDQGQLAIVVDSRGRVRNLHLFRDTPYWREVIVLCSSETPSEYREYLRSHEIKAIQTGKQHVDLAAALAILKSDYGVETIRVDSGGVLNGVLLRAGLVDEVSLLFTPFLIGGSSPSSFFTAPDLGSADESISLKLSHFEEVREGFLWVRYEVMK